MWNITLYPDLLVSFGHPTLINDAQVLIDICSNDLALPQLMSCDTTFNLGDFYISPFVIRNVSLIGDPVFPVAFLLHERKFKTYHQNFLRYILNLLNGDKIHAIPFVSDRERGIVDSIQQGYPNLPHIFCSNHIISDVDNWIKQHGGLKDDTKVLKDHVKQLINSSSLDSLRAV